MDYKIIEKATKNIVRHAGSYIATHELLKILWDKYIAEMKGYTKNIISTIQMSKQSNLKLMGTFIDLKTYRQVWGR